MLMDVSITLAEDFINRFARLSTKLDAQMQVVAACRVCTASSLLMLAAGKPFLLAGRGPSSLPGLSG